MSEDIKDLSLYGWSFTYNPLQGTWVAYDRNTLYFNGVQHSPQWNVFLDKDLDNLIKTVKENKNGNSNK